MKMTICMEMRGYICIFFSKTYVNVNLFIFKWNIYKFTRTQMHKESKKHQNNDSILEDFVI